jgi:hypothetical protein
MVDFILKYATTNPRAESRVVNNTGLSCALFFRYFV